MKRIYPAIIIAVVITGFASSTGAQMGMDLFRRPAIAKYMNPVVGKGAQYESMSKDSKDDKALTMEMGVTALDTVDGKPAIWMQITTSDKKDQQMLAKALVMKDDFQIKRMIMELPGQGAMEMPFNLGDTGQARLKEMSEWHSVGMETLTVPAGTFACEHWKNDKTGAEMWASDKVTPFGLVKEVGKSNTMVLTKLLTDVQDKITGPVRKFDPQSMMQDRQQQKK